MGDDGNYRYFLVNRETNYHWMRRLESLKPLAEWVSQNFSEEPVKFDGSRSYTKKITQEGKAKKGWQYVYEHLAVGKMMFPLEQVDPLFTASQYEDESLKLQLRPGRYRVFQRMVQDTLAGLHHEFTGECDASPTWEDLETQFTNELVTNKASQEIIQRLRRELCARLGEVNPRADRVDQEMIGLVLRYKCMGAFSDNLHGSIPGMWSELLGEEWVECFASPFNHKFAKYYSIYEQDRVFGSLGNFFSMLKLTHGVLPAYGKYEMNPPWNNQMYEKLEEILERSLACQSMIEVIVIGPKWKDTRWIPGITELIELNPGYTDNSFKGEREIRYKNDMTGRPFLKDSVYWVFSQTGIDDGILDRLDIPRPERAWVVAHGRRRTMGR